MCNHNKFVVTACRKICTICGEETEILKLDTFAVHSAPLLRGYNRGTRFQTKVHKLLGRHTGPIHSDPVWDYLNQRKKQFKTPTDIRLCLRASNLKNKHYDCLRVFSDAFCSSFEFPAVDNQKTQKYLMSMFEHVHSAWSGMNLTSFFSYSWLLRKFLSKVDSPLLVYLKPPTCSSRHSVYEKKLLTLFRNANETRNRVRREIHFPNARYPSNYHHNLLHQLKCRVAKCLSHFCGGRSRKEGSL